MVAFNLWLTDPENKPAPRQEFKDDTVGRLHLGYMDESDSRKPRPVALTEWRFTTGLMPVAQRIAELYGGTPQENSDSPSEFFIDVFTEAKRIPVIIEPDGIYADMKQWINGKLVHHCDGVSFLSPDEKKGEPCGCPTLFAERKQAARDYQGPSPSIAVTFRLADAPDLGTFKLQTGAWSLAAVLHESLEALEDLGTAARATLELEYVEYVAKKGPMRGKTVSYVKPVIKVKGAYDGGSVE